MSSTPARLRALQGRLERLREEIVAFWWPRGYDADHGGFHGALDREGRPSRPTVKTVVQQARHLFALCAYLERRGPDPALVELAEGTRAFLGRFADPRDGRYFWELDGAGTLSNPAKILYGQAFAVYGLSQYGKSLGAGEALDAALRCFDGIESRNHDAHFGGYHQSGDPPWLTGGASKDTNTHIHLMEAFTALHDATGQDRVRQRLAELVELICARLLQPAGYVHPYFERDLRPFGRPRVSYGHDIETAWLLLDAARSLGCFGDAVSAASLTMAKHAVERGFDFERGGLFDEGVPQGLVTSRDKVWWAQFEALAGLWWLYRLTGDETFLARLERTLDWIEGPARDATFGEWYWSVGPDDAFGEQGPGKGNAWKTTYHHLRAVLYLNDWIDGWHGWHG